MVVYIDVLFIINLIVNYFILLSVSQILKRHDKRPRIFLGALLGAVYACLMFFPQLGFLYTALLKLIFSVTIVAVSFKSYSVRNFLKLLTFFYVTSMLFGGIIFALQYFLSPPNLEVKNGIAYVDISPLTLILSSAAIYVAIKIGSRVFHKNIHTDDTYEVSLEIGGVCVNLTALLDNGNDLCDAISGSPVVVAEYAGVKPLIPEPIRQAFREGGAADMEAFKKCGFDRRFRVIPFGSVGNSGGLLPAFRPDRLTVKKDGIPHSDVLVAVTEKHLSDSGLFTMLLNPRIFENSEGKAGGDNKNIKKT